MQKVHLAVLLAVFMIFSPGCRMPPQPEPAREGEQAAQPTEVQLDGANFYVLHYFNDELGRKSMDEVISLFRQQQPEVKITGEPMDHETFKVAIPSLLEGARPPDVFSYWAGARVQAVVDAGELQPIDDLWASQNLDQAFPQGIVRGATYTLQVTNAGCITPLIRRVSGKIEWVDIGGLPLGVGLGADLGYGEVTVHLNKGDLIILVSDGVIEARNATRHFLGFERFERIVASGPTHSAEAMLEHLKRQVFSFTGETELYDDMTLVVMRV